MHNCISLKLVNEKWIYTIPFEEHWLCTTGHKLVNEKWIYTIPFEEHWLCTTGHELSRQKIRQ